MSVEKYGRSTPVMVILKIWVVGIVVRIAKSFNQCSWMRMCWISSLLMKTTTLDLSVRRGIY